MGSLRRIRRKACRGKVKHATQQAASFAARAMRRGHFLVQPVRPYHCRFCGSWHIGRSGGRGFALGEG